MCVLLSYLVYLSGFVLVQIALGQVLGFDPLLTSIPLTFGLLAADQLIARGAVAETVYQSLFPEYKKKIIALEAGHFLVAYLLGMSLRGCIVNARDAMKFPEIRGQAGTIFYVGTRQQCLHYVKSSCNLTILHFRISYWKRRCLSQKLPAPHLTGFRLLSWQESQQRP